MCHAFENGGFTVANMICNQTAAANADFGSCYGACLAFGEEWLALAPDANVFDHMDKIKVFDNVTTADYTTDTYLTALTAVLPVAQICSEGAVAAFEEYATHCPVPMGEFEGGGADEGGGAEGGGGGELAKDLLPSHHREVCARQTATSLTATGGGEEIRKNPVKKFNDALKAFYLALGSTNVSQRFLTPTGVRYFELKENKIDIADAGPSQTLSIKSDPNRADFIQLDVQYQTSKRNETTNAVENAVENKTIFKDPGEQIWLAAATTCRPPDEGAALGFNKPGCDGTKSNIFVYTPSTNTVQEQDLEDRYQAAYLFGNKNAAGLALGVNRRVYMLSEGNEVREFDFTNPAGPSPMGAPQPVAGFPPTPQSVMWKPPSDSWWLGPVVESSGPAVGASSFLQQSRKNKFLQSDSSDQSEVRRVRGAGAGGVGASSFVDGYLFLAVPSKDTNNDTTMLYVYAPNKDARTEAILEFLDEEKPGFLTQKATLSPGYAPAAVRPPHMNLEEATFWDLFHPPEAPPAPKSRRIARQQNVALPKGPAAAFFANKNAGQEALAARFANLTGRFAPDGSGIAFMKHDRSDADDIIGKNCEVSVRLKEYNCRYGRR
eukprot:g8111.t1